MNPVVHFEMPYENRERMANGPETPGAINGGFFPQKPDWPAQHPSIVIAVDDIEVPQGRFGFVGLFPCVGKSCCRA